MESWGSGVAVEGNCAGLQEQDMIGVVSGIALSQ